MNPRISILSVAILAAPLSSCQITPASSTALSKGAVSVAALSYIQRSPDPLKAKADIEDAAAAIPESGVITGGTVVTVVRSKVEAGPEAALLLDLLADYAARWELFRSRADIVVAVREGLLKAAAAVSPK